MNNRIAFLYEQAIEIENNGDYVAGEFNPVKFAELIVRECAELVKDFHQETEFTCYSARTEIKEHFGIEE